ncbi:hypothetical protein [Azospirillum sp.]|uniref:hypothetical protein n=1 Tax=Azospirillum sp. TaxID=34012 RepID=UPI003D7651C8
MNAISGIVVKDRALASESLTGLLGHAEPTTATVPLKPSAAMLAAGARAGGVSVEAAWKIYLAMIKAAE